MTNTSFDGSLYTNTSVRRLYCESRRRKWPCVAFVETTSAFAAAATLRWQLVFCTQSLTASKSVSSTSPGVLSRSCYPACFHICARSLERCTRLPATHSTSTPHPPSSWVRERARPWWCCNVPVVVRWRRRGAEGGVKARARGFPCFPLLARSFVVRRGVAAATLARPVVEYQSGGSAWLGSARLGLARLGSARRGCDPARG